jgi:selenide,water dikinase
VVDDPRAWGRVAAANAVSDVYAMGGRPLFALNVVAWPSSELGEDVLVEVLAGAADVALAGGFVTGGGHTIDDPVPKFGLAVLGEADPSRLLRTSGLRPGDALVLTKPLGTGIVTTAAKADQAPAGVLADAVASMTALNDVAAEAALDAGATGATDVTGFGLLGHLRRMVEASEVDVELEVASVPLLDGVVELAARGFVPGGTRRNLEWAMEVVDPGPADELALVVLADAQTSGGLLFGAQPERAHQAVERLRRAGRPAAIVGHVRGRGPGRVTLSVRPARTGR